ncbi:MULTISPECIES: MFS transporter [unclassified Thalassospira]|uniref:MFS transporter n=1 Tax=unclassified Thalassospira TaxID=2648997 RepID=UPI000C4B3649|nr:MULTISPECIES: MFS transporter [unclassified Thalassospira]MBC44723.1 MFS transporter [Thalassospira sp.]MBO6806762.1 MFS transporter [Thalassospira sp.]MBO6840384.1 MFS transporter [Thalassospira sp.]HAI33262.1 MFS transporter [Thalassospira sp.]|tara:strand:- start:3241 stop:4449 length:1209 start_codon:yes stop_codon:yes gene_type:complete
MTDITTRPGFFGNLPILALALASFGIGTTEFVIMGLLPDVALDLGVSIPDAGLLVTGYALGVTFGAPFLAIATARMDRRRALLLLISIFIFGNFLCAIAPDYWLLMMARVVTAFCHGAFFGLGAVVASNLVAPHKRVQAIALMFSGLTLANVLGVPFGTALGQELGWRSTFWAVVAIGIFAASALYFALPRKIAASTGSLWLEAKSLGKTQVLLAMLISVLASASMFSVFTYITPMLQEITGITPRQVTYVLLLFGVGLTLGNYIGGRLGDWRLMPAVIIAFVLLIAILATFTETLTSVIPAVATVMLWGVVAFALVSPLQMRVVNEASDAPNLASTLNQGAFNLGNAAGAWFGGIAITQGVSYQHIPWLGAAIAVLALLFTVWSHLLDRRDEVLVENGASA